MLNLKTVTVPDFQSIYRELGEAQLFDVRTPEEFSACHVQGAQLFPLQGLSVEALLREAEKSGAEAPLYLLCKAGGRAKNAGVLIAPQTNREVFVIEGGTDGCVESGMPIHWG